MSIQVLRIKGVKRYAHLAQDKLREAIGRIGKK